MSLVYRARSEIGLSLLAMLCGAALLIISQQYESQRPEKFLFKYVPPPAHVEKFVFGYRDTFADALWVRVIQDMDMCETGVDGKAGGTEQRGAQATCRKGWVYQMLDAITTLAPKWKMPYRIGGTLLSIMVDDREGAALLLEKGMREFPTDYNLHYTAAYHYIYEMKNPKRAAETLLVAAANGGPPWFYALAGKLYTDAGQALIAKQVLEEALSDERNAVAAERIKNRLKQADEVLARSNGPR